MNLDARTRQVLHTSFYVTVGFCAFLFINLWLDGLVQESIRLGLGVWAMQLITFPLMELRRKISFAKWVALSALTVAVVAILHYLIKYLWQHF